jgi:O-antigen/teichoic acid export membrane protein
LHSTSSLWADGRIGDLNRLASRVTRQILLLVVLLAVGLATLADTVLGLYYGPEFVAATLPLLILLPGTVAFAAARPLKAIAQGSGEMRTLLLAIGAAAALNLGLNALLIPLFGMVGAAVATSLGYASMLGFMLFAAARIGFDPLGDLRPDRIAVTAGVTAVPVVGLDWVLGSDLLALIVVPPVGALVFAATAVAVGALDPSEARQGLAYVPQPLDGVLHRGLALVEP